MATKKAKPEKLAVFGEEIKSVTKRKPIVRTKKVKAEVDEPIQKIKVTDRTQKTKQTKKKPAVHVEVKTSTPYANTATIVRNQFQLALLSPFRFPIDNDRLASQVARYAGAFFVVVGAVFTLLNMQYVDGSYAVSFFQNQQAQTVSYNCSDPLSSEYDPVYCNAAADTGSIDETPPVDLVIEGTQPYQNMVPINVYVPYATGVDIFAYYKTGGTNITLGKAMKVSETMWRFYWDTKQYNDGEYRIKILVTNSYGSYDYTQSSYSFVENYPVAPAAVTPPPATTTTPTAMQYPTATTTGGTATGTSSTPTTAATTTPTVTLRIDENSPLQGYATVKTFVHGAAQVKISVRKDGDTTPTFVGYAIDHGDGEWRFEWNTNNFANGGYAVKAQAIFTGVSYASNYFTTSILNTTATVATTTGTPTTTAAQPPLEPAIGIIIPESSPLEGDADILLSVEGANTIELFVLPKNSLTPYFLGLAQKQNLTEWRFKWNTKQTPNGEYAVFAKVKHAYGTTNSKKVNVAVKNELVVPVSPEQETQIEEMENVNIALEDSVTPNGAEPTTPQAGGLQPPVPPIYVTSLTGLVDETDLDNSEKEEITQILKAFRTRIEQDLRRLSVAVREGDENEMRVIREDIERVRKDIIEKLPLGNERADIIARLDEHLRTVVKELEELTVRNEAIIKERIGDAALKDSDRDGITDYDEVNIYYTDPFGADTDGDGFIDGTEVFAGYDPTDSVPQALVTYESPQEVGTVREDLLVVETIIGMSSDETEATESSAIIKGKALPNSFVTLYVYSTPIVVTVKTDAEGGWSYIFDKELEDGAHEVYIGITDNAGRIVAKSNPLAFVKTAQAFTPVDAQASTVVPAESSEPTLFNQNIMFVVSSIAVVALGLVLMLLGFYVNSRRPLVPSVQ